MRIHLATGNPHKRRELAAILAANGAAHLELEIVPPDELAGAMPAVLEDGETFAANATKKAQALRAFLRADAWTMADDSGLVVEALGGAPGVHSARFAGAGATDEANTRKLLRELEGFGPEARRACFHCAIALAIDPGRVEIFEGRCAGRILDAPRGKGGFGYDPVFVPDGHDQTFAELPAEVKDRISHRARAVRKLVDWLRRRTKEA